MRTETPNAGSGKGAMMETLCLIDEQARQIANGERAEVWVPHDKPLGEPYCDETEAHQYNKAGTAWFLFAGSDANTIRVVRAPFLSGAVVGVREAWSSFFDDADEGGIGGDVPIFRATYADDMFEDPAEVDWQPAETMPDWAIRSRPTCVSCVPKKRDQWGWLVTLEPTKTGAH